MKALQEDSLIVASTDRRPRQQQEALDRPINQAARS